MSSSEMVEMNGIAQLITTHLCEDDLLPQAIWFNGQLIRCKLRSDCRTNVVNHASMAPVDFPSYLYVVRSRARDCESLVHRYQPLR